MSEISGFQDAVAELDGVQIAYSIAGSGPPVLLLHGFPQTRAMWHDLAPKLAADFTVVAADLRGYGASSKPFGTEAYSFRHMANDQLNLMHHLGFDRFHLVGHDRGGRTAHRLALDTPSAVQSLTVMDIVPTHLLLRDLTQEVATDYYHWFFLAQPAPFPETLINADPKHFFESCLLGWGGSQLDAFDPAAMAAYRTAWANPDTVRGMCADYRATLEYDYRLDIQNLQDRVACPVHVLFGSEGAMAKSFDVPATWADRGGDRVTSEALPGGHFFPDTHPNETFDALHRFLRTVS